MGLTWFSVEDKYMDVEYCRSHGNKSTARGIEINNVIKLLYHEHEECQWSTVDSAITLPAFPFVSPIQKTLSNSKFRITRTFFRSPAVQVKQSSLYDTTASRRSQFLTWMYMSVSPILLLLRLFRARLYWERRDAPHFSNKAKFH